jgi:hypothetical protein
MSFDQKVEGGRGLRREGIVGREGWSKSILEGQKGGLQRVGRCVMRQMLFDMNSVIRPVKIGWSTRR